MEFEDKRKKYRQNVDEYWDSYVDTSDFLRHLSLVSQPVFHKQMFQLILYSINCKVELFKKASLQVKGEYNAKAIAEGLDADDVQKTIASRRRGNYTGGTFSTNELLKAVTAVSKALPHTNEAAAKARGTAESMMHHFLRREVYSLR